MCTLYTFQYLNMLTLKSNANEGDGQTVVGTKYTFNRLQEVV